jgi:hypothetical protein
MKMCFSLNGDGGGIMMMEEKEKEINEKTTKSGFFSSSFILCGGKSNENRGGGIMMERKKGGEIIRNCLFMKCRSEGKGGGIYLEEKEWKNNDFLLFYCFFNKNEGKDGHDVFLLLPSSSSSCFELPFLSCFSSSGRKRCCVLRRGEEKKWKDEWIEEWREEKGRDGEMCDFEEEKKKEEERGKERKEENERRIK